MEHNGKFKGPGKGLKRQHSENKLNVLTCTKNDDSKIVINDLDTQSCTVQDSTKKLRNDPKDSKLDNGSDRSDVSEHSVDNNAESSNTGCDDMDEFVFPTDPAEVKILLNNFKVQTHIKGLLRRDLSIEEFTIKWPITILLHSNDSIEVSKEEFEDIIFKKTEKVITSKTRFALEMYNASTCKEQQYSWYKKYQALSNYKHSIIDKLEALHAKRFSHNAAIGTTSVNKPENNNAAEDLCKIDPQFFPF